MYNCISAFKEATAASWREDAGAAPAQTHCTLHYQTADRRRVQKDIAYVKLQRSAHNEQQQSADEITQAQHWD